MKSTFVVPAVGVGLMMGAMALPTYAANYNANDTASLTTAINSAVDGDTITLTGDITLTADVPAITHSVTLFSNTHSINDGGFNGIDINSASKTLVLNGSNSNVGTTKISAGTISITNNSSMGSTGITVNTGNHGQTLNYDNSGGNLVVGNNITLNGLFTVNVNSGVATQNGSLSGAWGLTKTGAGELALNHDNSSFTGTVDLNNGTLGLLQTGVLGTGNLIVDDNANNKQLIYASGVDITNDIHIDTSSGDNGTLNLFVNSGNEAIQSGAIIDNNFLTSNEGSIIKSGGGTLILSANNNYSGGTTVNGGTLEVFNADSGAVASVGDVTTTNGATTEALFHSIDPLSNQIYTTNLGHQTIIGPGTANFGNNDVVLNPYSDNNTDTITINGIEADATGGAATVNIGGGRHTVTGDGNEYKVNVNTSGLNPYALDLTNGATANVATGASSANSISGVNNKFANTITGDVNVASGSSLTLFGGNNSIIGNGNNNNQFTNTITGNVGVDASTLTLDAGVLNASSNPSIASNNISGNTVNGDVTLTNGSNAYIIGQTTDSTNSGSNSSSNTIGGANGLSLTDSDAHISGHNNNMNVEIGSNSLASVYQQNIAGQSGLTLENSITGDVTVNGNSTLALGADFGFPIPILYTTYLTGNSNTITNTVNGTVNFDSTNGGDVLQASLLDVTGNNNHINNTLTQNFTLNSTSGSSLYQSGIALNANGASAGNQINNIITGDVTVDGANNLLVQQGGNISGYDNSGNGGSSAGYSATDNKGNQITNTIDGHVTVYDGNFLIDGERNIVTDGVTTTSALGTHIGGGDETAGGATIHNESTADHTASYGGRLHIGTNPGPGTQTITGSNNNILNRVKGDSGLGIEGSITVTFGGKLGLGDGLSDSGDLNIVGGGNSITNSVGSANTASGNAQLQTVTNGGEVLLGGRDITSSSTGNVINNSVTQDVTLGANSGDSGYLELAGTGTGSTTGANAATVNNTITGNVTANGGSTVYLYGSNGSNAINTITGAVNLNDDSYLQAYDGGTAANGNVVSGGINLNSTATNSVIAGLDETGTGINRDNSLRGDIHLQNGNTSNVFIGESITNNGASANTISNTHVGAIDTNGSSSGTVVLAGTLTNTSTGGTSITNQQTGNVTMNGGNVLLSGTFNQPAGPVSSISNTITGDVDMNTSGSLHLFSDNNTSNNVTTTNKIIGAATLNDSTSLLATGANNTITNSLYLNQTTVATVGGSSNTTITGADVTNTLVVNGSGVVVSGNPDSYSNAGNGYNGQQQNADHSYNIDSGHVIVGASGGSNIATGHSITNTLDANVTLNGDANYNYWDGSNSYLNSGGKLVLGGASNTLNANGSVTNEVTGTVNLHGGSRLYLGDETITGDGSGSVTNQIDGNVNADANSYISIIGDHNPDDGASTVNNTLSGQLNTYNNVLTEVSGGNNSVTGGTYLYGNSSLQLSALNSWNQAYQNELTSSVNLYNNSDLILGNQPSLGSNSTMVANNLITGNVSTDVNSYGAVKVLSGGAGGTHSAAGLNEITGNLTLHSGINFDVSLGSQNTDDAVSTGVAVDGTSTLNGATVRVTDIDPINYANGHADFTFGRRHTLVQALGAGSVANGFATNAQLYDVNGNSVYAPALDLTTGWDSSSAYLDWLTDFHGVANTTNQQNFGQYLDDLVANSIPDGITHTNRPELSTVLNYLVSRDPSAMNDFTGDSYSAFDMAGYWNANRFANEVATHARQSHDNDWTESFALNAKNGLSGVGAQMSLVKQLLNSRPTMQLNAKSDGGMWGNDNGGSNNALWGNVSGTRLNNDGDSSLGSPDWDLSTKSVAIGYQGGGNSFSWGITGGYHNGDINFNNRHADGDNDGWNAGLNGLWKSKSNTYVSGLLTYGHESNSLTRNDGLGTNKSDFNSKTYAAMLEVGKRINKKTYNFTPYVSLLGVKYDRDALSESGSGAGVNSSLDVNGESHSYLTSSLGVRIGRDYLDKSGQKKGGIMLGANWQHQFSSTDFPVTAALQGAAGMVPGSYTTYGTPLASDSLGIQLGAYGRLSSNIFGFLNYSGNFGGDQKINSITAGLQYGF